MLTIDGPDAIFMSPALTQDVWQPPSTITWTDANAPNAVPSFDCGAIQFAIENSDGSAIDAAVFTANLPASVGASNTLVT